MSAIVLLIALLAADQTMASEDCTRQLDILLIVDGSSTVCNGTQTCPEWNSTLEFCKNIVNSFKIGPDDTHVAFMLLANDVLVKWNLTGHTDVTTLLPAIDNVAYTGGVFTDIPSAISVITEVFNPLDTSADRADALDVIFAITDGIPDIGPLLARALSTLFQQTRIAAFLVCVRPGCTENWIRGIASPPQKVNETYFLVDSYFLLDPVKDDVVNKICPYQLQLPLVSGWLPAS